MESIIILNANEPANMPYRIPLMYVGRGKCPNEKWQDFSILGNPFKIDHLRDREAMIAMYKEWLQNELKTSIPIKISMNQLYQELKQHYYIGLICWCAPERCHCEVIREIIYQAIDKKEEFEYWQWSYPKFVQKFGEEKAKEQKEFYQDMLKKYKGEVLRDCRFLNTINEN